MNRVIAILIAAAAGWLMIAAFYLPSLEWLSSTFEKFFSVIAAFALVLGGGHLLVHHLRQISDGQPGWGYSAVTVTAFVVTVMVGLLKVGVLPADDSPDYLWSGAYQDEGSAFWWLYEYVMQPITATMFSLLAFYVASAAFRAFRARSVEAGLLLGTAILVLLGRSAIGTLVSEQIRPFPGFAEITAVIMDVFNTGGQRAILIGVALGVTATSLRILVGADQNYLGRDS